MQSFGFHCNCSAHPRAEKDLLALKGKYARLKFKELRMQAMEKRELMANVINRGITVGLRKDNGALKYYIKYIHVLKHCKH